MLGKIREDQVNHHPPGDRILLCIMISTRLHYEIPHIWGPQPSGVSVIQPRLGSLASSTQHECRRPIAGCWLGGSISKDPTKLETWKGWPSELKQAGCEVVLGHGVMFGQWFGGPFSAIRDSWLCNRILQGGVVIPLIFPNVFLRFPNLPKQKSSHFPRVPPPLLWPWTPLKNP